MKEFLCKNCSETWDVNSFGGLIPQYFPGGAWHLTNYENDNCPACFEIDTYTKGEWMWRD